MVIAFGHSWTIRIPMPETYQSNVNRTVQEKQNASDGHLEARNAVNS